MAVEKFIMTLGQSTFEPKAPANDYFTLVPDLNYLSADAPGATTYQGYGVEEIRYLTFFLPDGGTYSGSPPSPFDTLGYRYYCQFLPWTIERRAGTGRTNPAPAGFDYANAYGLPVDPATSNADQRVSQGPEIARRIMGFVGQRINIVHLAIDSTQLQHQETKLAFSAVAWFNPNQHSHWSPADSTSLFGRLREMLTGMAVAADVEGNTYECIGIFIDLSQTEAGDARARELFEVNAPAFVKALRDLIDEFSLAERSGYQTPIVWAKPQPTVWNSTAAVSTTEIEATLDAMEDDDPYFATFSTSTLDVYLADPIHWGPQNIVDYGELAVSAWRRARDSAFQAVYDERDVPTLAELRTAVRRLSERGTSDSGQDDPLIDEAINESYFELINTVGDTTWWLRQVMTFTMTASPTTAVDLPRRVTRLLEIRPTEFPWETIDFSMVQHSDRGRVRIVTFDIYTSESTQLHYMYEPNKLTMPGEKPLLPPGYVEAVKLGAARRVVTNAGNKELEKKLMAQEKMQVLTVSAHANKVDRQRRQRLTGRRGTRYRRQPWDFTRYHPWNG